MDSQPSVKQSFSGLVNPAESTTQASAFRIVEERQRSYRKFGAQAREVVILVDSAPHDVNPEEWLQGTFRALIDHLFSDDIAPQDRIGFTFYSAARVGQRPIGLSVRRKDQFSVDVLLQLLELCVQSNENLFVSGPMRVVFLHVSVPIGGVRNARIDYTSDFHTFCSRKKGIITITNDDNLCLARALVVAMAFLKKDESLEATRFFDLVKKHNRNKQSEEAQRLCRDASVDLSEHGSGPEELWQFQNYLGAYCITVFTDRRGKETIFEGPIGTPDHPRKNIDLIFGENHYNVITSLTGAFTAKHYCRHCKHADSHSVPRHRCPEKCPACIQLGLCEDSVRVDCNICNRCFYGQSCYDRHFLPSFGNASACQTLKKCLDCLHTYSLARVKRDHICGESKCTVCNKYVPPNHLCYMQPANKLTSRKPYLFVFFDFECTQETTVPDQPGSFEHIPNLCISEQTCPTCVNVTESEHQCDFCGIRKHVFEGPKTVQDFVAYLAVPRPQFQDVVVIAHNFQGYDGQFILRHMMENLGWNPDLIFSGSKIQSIKYSHLHFIDSLNFFNASLSKLPKMLDLGELGKGYFPHFFNKIRNSDYVGPIPPAGAYGCDDMTVEDRATFFKWYTPLAMDSSYVFDFKTELYKYCSQDVKILRLACLKFRATFIEENQVDPFRQAVTIAGACMKVFRTLFLKRDTISIIPSGGYRMGDRQSREALCWLMWEAHSKNIDIQHTGNGREKKICGVKVDGYSENGADKIVWEYHGCWYHGCPLCFKNRDTQIKGTVGDTMDSRYQKTVQKTELLRRNSFKVIEMWSCQFEVMKQGNPGIELFINSRPEIRTPPLDPREAFYGGRTNATKLYYKAKESEQIKYFDVCSLYPYVCKNGVFPVGHPTILVGNDCPSDLSGIDGLIKADILPPDHLYHPVLPTRFNGKLCFVLCRSCAESMKQEDCCHNNEERALSGTWVIGEVRKALELGYSIKKVHEVWKYNTTKYDKTTNSGGLFVEYINKFLKMKQEASGWPAWCTTDDLRSEYIRRYEEREGIKLNPDQITLNPGLRSLAKIMLNSFWGKFGQRPDLPQTTIVKDRASFLEMLTDPAVEVDTIAPISDNIIMLNWHHKRESLSPHPYTNVVIASFVTAQARLVLYSYLERLGDRVFYFDTDSIIFIQRPGEEEVETGEFLGQMSDEIAPFGPSAFINEFVSGGPKNYAYQVAGIDPPKTVCKVRGITINYRNSELVSFNQLKNMVVCNAPSPIVPTPFKIARPQKGIVVTREEQKIFRVVYDKRRRVEDFDTLPYGGKKIRKC